MLFCDIEGQSEVMLVVSLKQIDSLTQPSRTMLSSHLLERAEVDQIGSVSVDEGAERESVLEARRQSVSLQKDRSS